MLTVWKTRAEIYIGNTIEYDVLRAPRPREGPFPHSKIGTRYRGKLEGRS